MNTVLSAIIVIDAEAVSTDKFQTPCPGSAAGKLFKTRHNNNLLSANNALYDTKNTPKTQRHGKIGVSQFFFLHGFTPSALICSRISHRHLMRLYLRFDWSVAFREFGLFRRHPVKILGLLPLYLKVTI